MKFRKDLFAILLTAASVLLNVAGYRLAVSLNLPIWLDSVGTVLAAYALGPVAGVAVGVSANVIKWILFRSRLAYIIVSIAIGAVTGVLARRGRLETFFDVMAVSTLLSLICVVFSGFLNIFVYNGMTGNEWGDGVIYFLMEHGFNRNLSYAIGQAYIEFLDKSITLLLLYLLVRLTRALKEMTGNGKNPYAGPGPALALLLAAGLAAGGSFNAEAAQTQGVDFYSYVQTIYNGTNGLMGGEANDIAQTRDGILWVGTYSGLYRFNGRSFRMVDDFSSVRNVNCLYTDEEGRLWIGTNDNGLTVSINEAVSNVLDESSGLPSNSVRSIVQGSDGYYYIGTSRYLQVLTLNGGLSLTDTLEDVVYAQSLAADREGRVAAVTAGGELFLLRGGSIVSRIVPDSRRVNYTCCIFGPDGRLYIGTSEGRALMFDFTGDTLVLKDSVSYEGLRSINGLTLTEDGLLFACADNGVGCRLQDGTSVRIHMNQFEYSVYHMLVDYQGNYWFTSSRHGLLRMTRSFFSDIYSSAGIEQRLVNSSVLHDGCLYVGTDSGLDIVNMEERSPVYSELTGMLDGVRIRCIKADQAGWLWICTYGQGLFVVSPSGEIERHDSGSDFCDWVRLALESSDGSMMVSGDAGIAWFRDGRLERLLGADSISTAMVLSLYEEEDGTLLAGTDGDGLAVIRNGEKIGHRTTESGLSSGVIMRIVPADSGRGYYLVTSNGLCYMDSDRNARLLDNFPYFNNYDVWSIGDGRLFVLSSAGVFVVNEQELLSGAEDLAYELLDARKGLNVALTANSWNFLDGADTLYLSTDRGVYTINLGEYGYQQKTYRIKLSAVRLDGRQQQVEKGVDISVPRSTMLIELSPEVVNYTLDDPMISIQLNGFDAEPTIIRYSDLKDFVYTNLPSGRYEFSLAVLDAAGDAIEKRVYVLDKELQIQDHLWFRIYLVAVFGAFTAWIAFFISRIVFRRQIERQKRETEMANQTIMAIARTVDAKDENTSQHSHRVSEYAVLIAREMGFSDQECENLRKAALLHDIGKIGIPDRILNKPDRLTDEEYAVMKSHVTRGADILKDFTSVDHVVEGALYHHERYDGRGYVSGLKGTEIPLYGRIIGVADAFDAMSMTRVYRKGIDINIVLEEIERCKGSQFDPEIADILVRLVHEGKIRVPGQEDAVKTEGRE